MCTIFARILIFQQISEDFIFKISMFISVFPLTCLHNYFICNFPLVPHTQYVDIIFRVIMVLPPVIHLCTSINAIQQCTRYLILAEMAFIQKCQKEYAAKCNMLTVCFFDRFQKVMSGQRGTTRQTLKTQEIMALSLMGCWNPGSFSG